MLSIDQLTPQEEDFILEQARDGELEEEELKGGEETEEWQTN